MHRIAIYDMDKTITAAPTWTRFLVHAARARAPWRLALMPGVALAAAGYGLKLIDRARLKQVAQRLVLGGALGNLTDRLLRAPGPLRGHVVDFLAMPHWPVFNLADSAIVSAAALVALLTATGRHLDGSRVSREPADG